MDSNNKRYYLHRKIKNYGVVVHSRQKLVEMEEKLFRFPPALLSVYLYKLLQFNYSIQSTIMTASKKELIAKNSFVSPELLTEKFNYASRRLSELEKVSVSVKVDTEEQLVVAENLASETLSLIKEVEASRKLLKGPYADTVKMIDSYCKTITENLERVKMRFTSEVTKYKVVKEAQLKAERDAKVTEIKTLEQEKTEEAERIIRIYSQIVARIYGGTYKRKDGENMVSPGCLTPENCEELDEWIQLKVPAKETMKYFQTDYEDALLQLGLFLAEHKANLIDVLKPDYPTANIGAAARIYEARTGAQVQLNTLTELLMKKIEKEVKSEVRSIDNEIGEAGKGVRDRIVFEVIDELLVPRDMLSVDSRKVNDYINANKEQIREALSKGEETIPGIRFSVENKFIAR